MATVADYLDRYGVVPLSRLPLNEIDCYLLCKLGCPDYSGIVPQEGSVSLPEAVGRYFSALPEARLGLLSSPLILPAIRKLAEAPRFRAVTLCDFVNRVDEGQSEQLSALTVGLPDGARFVTFRGTDDTLAAWKENFLLSVEDEIPAQRDAARYLLEEAAKTEGTLLAGGHSKGGNLAVYAALSAPGTVQNRIETVFNFDGPGFRRDLTATASYRNIRPKLQTVLSQHAIVGRLLHCEPACTIVKSSLPGISAHDGFRWETSGTRFVRCDEFALPSNAFRSAIEELADGMDQHQRRLFIDELFSVFSATGAVTLMDMTEKHLKNAVLLAAKMHKSPEIRQFLHKLTLLFLQETAADTHKAVEQKLSRPREE